MAAVLKIEAPRLRDLNLGAPTPALDRHRSSVSQRVHRAPLTRATRIERLTSREPAEKCPLLLVQM